MTVVVRVDVNESWSDEKALRVKDSMCITEGVWRSNCDDEVSRDANVGKTSRFPSSIDEQSPTNDQVVHGRIVAPLLLSLLAEEGPAQLRMSR